MIEYLLILNSTMRVEGQVSTAIHTQLVCLPGDGYSGFYNEMVAWTADRMKHETRSFVLVPTSRIP